ncbi:MAG: T9SS type A sorting domain-containing protein [Lewinellaceae bacterium]|nr:T9SS type A sorting domain-containing protein [Lewinellaceae bacterium]MCB9291504.1 T9SS type A sorting domain-containing protein [Lewinellaceae bacterium]
MITRITPFLSLFLFCFSLSLHATHNRSGEIEYRQVGPKELEASVITYTRASSLPADRDTVTICWGDGICERIARVNGPDLNGNGVPDGEIIAPNVKMNIYTYTHQYEEGGAYVLTMTDPNRNGGILNINFPNSDQVKFHIESSVILSENDPMNNHSPVLQEPPVGIGIVGEPFIHVPNAFDIDDDSVAYALAVPLQERGVEVPNYVWPDMVGAGPDNQLSIDPETGVLVWDAPQRAGEYNIAMEIRSYRNGELVDVVFRDMQILIDDAEHLLPTITLTETEEGIIDVAVGDTVRVDVTASSPLGQMVELTASCGLLEDSFFASPASFTATNINDDAEGAFTWIVRDEHIRRQPYLVAFRARDEFEETGAVNFEILRFRVSGVVPVKEPPLHRERVETYPNPASGAVQVSLHNIPLPVVYQLYHANGQLAAAGVFRKEQETLDLSGLPQGMYILRVGHATEEAGVKIIRR